MDIEALRGYLGWCIVLNLGLLVWWLLWLTLAHEWVYRFHGRWFDLSKEQFDAIQYASMGAFKIAVIVFNVVPYLALRIYA